MQLPLKATQFFLTVTENKYVLLLLINVLLLVTYVPALSLWLPSLLKF
jgi:TRAP-type C4-dicarboxylate transport system permease large subunit